MTDAASSTDPRRRVLFVDDEPSILDALRNILRKQRHVWDMVFVPSAEAALQEIAQAPFDVVVSDMRMPGMDGATLLTRVKELCPGAARIVLSGHADRDTAGRTLPVAHQFLGKPCDMNELRNVVERTCRLTSLLADPAIRNVVARLDKLPSPPRVYLELTAAVNDPSVSVAGLAAVVERDPAMSLKVLQVCNSAFFGLAKRVDSIQQAVVYLGADLLKALTLGAHVFAMAEGPEIQGFSFESMRNASLTAAGLARKFARDRKTGDAAFTAAVVHDVGYVALAGAFADKLAEIARRTRAENRPFHSVERDVLGVTHAEISAYLIGVWGLPFELVEATAYHHTPTKAPVANDVLAIAHAVDVLVRDGHGRGPEREAQLDRAFLESAGFGGDLGKWMTLAREKTGETL